MKVSSNILNDNIEKYQKNKNDTGSSEIQIISLTNHITRLVDHFKKHKKDNHSRRGLIHKVNRRKKLLKYLKNNNSKIFYSITKSLNIRIKK